MPSLTQLREELDAKRQQAHDIFAKGDIADMSGDDVKTVRGLNDDMTKLSKQIDELVDLEDIQKGLADAEQKAKTPVTPVVNEKGSKGSRPRVRSLAEIFEETESVKNHFAAATSGRKGKGFSFEISADEMTLLGAKTVVTLSDISPQNTRLPGILGPAEETRTVADMLLQGTIGGTTLEYYEETTTTNSAATVAEGGTKPESALDFTLRSETISKIATWIPATDELLSDMPAMRSYIEGRLRYFIEREEEAQILSGDGEGSNLTGILERSGIQTQAKGEDPVPDAIYKAMNLVRINAFMEPTGVIFHPSDWQAVRLLRTADGVYIWGSPADAGPERIWGLNIRQTTGITENSALVVTREAAQVYRRTGVTVETSSEHASYFVENKQAIRAEERMGLAVYRPSAFVEVTGI